MKTFTGIKDADREILSKLESDEDLLKTCIVNKYTFELCNNQFFLNRLIKKFPDTKSLKPDNMSWKQYYLYIIYYAAKIYEDFGFNFVSGNPKIYYNILDENYSLSKNNTGLVISAENGYLDLVNYFIKRGANNFDMSLISSARNGNMKIVELLISKGARSFNSSLCEAAKHGHKKLVDYFISLGADNLNQALYCSALGNQLEIIKYLISLGADGWKSNKSGGTFLAAVNNGDSELINYIMNLMLTNNITPDWNVGMHIAAQTGNKEAIDFFIEQGANKWQIGLDGANFVGNNDLINFFINKMKD